MHISGLAIEKFDIRANLGTNGVTSLLLLLSQEISRLECSAVVVVKYCLTTFFGTNGHLSGIAIRKEQYSPLIK